MGPARTAGTDAAGFGDGLTRSAPERGPVREFLRRLLQQRMAFPGLAIIVAILVCAVFADASWVTAGRSDRLLIAQQPYQRADLRPEAVSQGPSLARPLGTDQLGRDVYSRIVFGARVSLLVAVVAVAIAVCVGVPLGVLAGFAGGWLDELVIMRAIDMMMAFPTIVLLLVLAFAIGPSMTTAMIVIGVAYSPGYARLSRAVVLSSKEEAYVLAARSLGATPFRVVVFHVLPSLLAPLLVLASLSMAGAILFEASLSFLGVGIQPPTPAWGSMLRDGYIFVERNTVPAVAPGVAIFLIVLGFSFLGDAIRDATDPTLRGRS